MKSGIRPCPSMKMRGDYSDGDIDFEEGFYVLKHSICPEELTESGFMTNEKECRWVQTEETLSALVLTHVEGISKFVSQ